MSDTTWLVPKNARSAALTAADRAAYEQHPELTDADWGHCRSVGHCVNRGEVWLAQVGISDDVGLDGASVINCDGIHTVSQSMLTTHVGAVDDDTLRHVCSAVAYSIGC